MEAVIAIQSETPRHDRRASWVRIANVVLRIVMIYLMLAAIVAMGSANAHPFVYGGF
jgi:hypothetical protein